MKINHRRSSPEYKFLRQAQKSGQAYNAYQMQLVSSAKRNKAKIKKREDTGLNADGSRYMPYTRRSARASHSFTYA